MKTTAFIAFCDAFLDPIVIVNPSGRIVAANAALCSRLGYSKDEIQRLNLSSLVPRSGRQEQNRQLQSCLQGERIIAVPAELQGRDGPRVPVIQTLSDIKIEDEGGNLVVISFKERTTLASLERLNTILENNVRSSSEDVLDQTVTALEAEVSERQGVEKELRMSRRQLRLLSQKTLELLESDRQLIARELHDSIGASLAAIKFSLEGWLEVYGDHLPSPEIPFDRIIDHIGETIKETKRISANLRPSTLDDLGLLATTRWFCRDLSGLYSGIRITPQFEVHEDDIPEALKIVLYRVIQEALSNAAKHSGAEEIRVDLSLTEGLLIMNVTDDGCGFDVESIMDSEDILSGFGINSMRERIEICGGQFELRSRIGEGTRIHVSLPVESISSENISGLEIQSSSRG
jgi:PAS domain S-box-containing protein